MLNESSDSENDADYIPEDDQLSCASVISSDSDLCSEDDSGARINSKRKRKRHASSLESEIIEEMDESQAKAKSDSLWNSFLSSTEKVVGTKKSDMDDVTKRIPNPDVPTQALPSREQRIDNPSCPIDACQELSTKNQTTTVESVKPLVNDDKILNGATVEQARPTISRRGGHIRRGGLSSVLSKIGKKPKMSCLDKSKVDWESFKTSRGLIDELAIHNRGKHGYIERQQFLCRTDVKTFELERNIRLQSSARK